VLNSLSRYSNPLCFFVAMASHASGSRAELFDSAVTLPSDSENYSPNNDLTQSESPSSSSGSPMILYQPPSVWGLLRGAAINLLLPFVNGLMLGFGELFAHEAAFRLGWSNTKVRLTEMRCCANSTTNYHTLFRSSQITAEHTPWVPGLRFANSPPNVAGP
jgi:hypothetical protein